MAGKPTENVPSEEGQTSEQPPESVSSDKGEEKPDEAPLEVPEKLRGKSVEELAQQYQNLEKKLGEQSAEVNEARQIKKDSEILLSSIYSDPTRYKQVVDWMKDYLGGGKTDDPKGSGEAGTESQSTETPKTDDTRRVLQNQILTDFYRKHGLDKLPDDERKGEQTKLATAFADLVDPGGTKPVQQLLNGVPLDKLPKFLESAYVLANAEKLAGQGRDILTAEENRQASIGSLSATSGTGGESTTLTPEERAVATRMGISAEDYLKSKAALEKQEQQKRRL
jgi:hypothetical protein